MSELREGEEAWTDEEIDAPDPTWDEIKAKAKQLDNEKRRRAGLPSLEETALIIPFPSAKSLGEMIDGHPEIDMRAVADRLRARAAQKLHERCTDGGEDGEVCTDAPGEDGQPPQLEPEEDPGTLLLEAAAAIPSAFDGQPVRTDAELGALAVKLEEVEAVRPPRNFDWWTASSRDMDLDADRDLIERVLPAEGIIVIYGKEKTGKTQLAMDMGLHLSLGWAWRGIETEAAGVSYFNPEGGKGAKLRVAAWCREHRVERVDNFRLSTAAVDLFSEDCDVDAVIDDIERSQPGCKLVIFDTLNRVMPGGDENTVKDMGILIRNVDRIASKLGIAVILIHHEPKTGGGPRGSGSLGGALNAQLHVVREQHQPGQMEVDLLRDGEPGLKFGFSVKSVLLGEDRKGRPVTAAVAVPAPEPDGAKVPERKLTDYQVIVLEALTQLVNERGQPNPGGDGFPEPGRVKVVSIDQLLSFATEKLVSANKKERPRIVTRAITTLQGRGLVKVQGDLVWNPKHVAR